MGVTRTTMSHGVRRTTSRLESLRTTAASTARPTAEAADIAAATARRLSAACISRCLLPVRAPRPCDSTQPLGDLRCLSGYEEIIEHGDGGLRTCPARRR